MDDNLPTPLEGLKETGPTPFLTKTYNIVEDSSTNNIVSWSRDNNSFIVWEPETFALIILPRCFKHKNFSSFVRQLNTYGFKKIDTERWEFANEYFLRGQRHLLKNIKRRKTSSQTQTQSLEGCRFGLEGEIQGMRRERVDLLIELMRLRRKQESVKTNLHLMEEKLKVAEMKQELMMDFLLRTMKNPSFLQSLRKRKLHLMEEKLKVTEMKQELMMDFLLRTMKNPSFLQSLRKRKHQGKENREQGQEMISSHVVEDHENFIKVEPEEFGNDDELHIASMEDQEQDEIEMEMDSEGLWKGFVLSEEMCDLILEGFH